MRTVKLNKKGQRVFLNTLLFLAFFIVPILAVSLVRTSMLRSLSRENLEFKKGGVEGKAITTRILSHQSGRGTSSCTVDYIYKFANSDYQGNSISNWCPRLKVGDSIEIYINPKMPQRSMPSFLLTLDKEESLINQGFNHYVYAIVISLILFFELLAFWIMRKTYLVLKNGEILDATIVKTILGQGDKPRFVTIHFNIFGKTIEQKVVACRDRDYSVGSKLKVAYWQKMPSKVIQLPDPDFDL